VKKRGQKPFCLLTQFRKIDLLRCPHSSATEPKATKNNRTMALNRFFTRPASTFNGFDDFFAPPTPLFRDPFFEHCMPVLHNVDRDVDSVIRRSSPGYEINETEDKYSICVDVPGVKAADMAVQLENDGRVLHLIGGRKVQKGDSTTEHKFSQRFTIGNNVDTTKLSADLTNGVLCVSAPKLKVEEKKPITIAITEGRSKL
jgi:HSP20 family protein